MGFALKALGADETVARQIGINTVALKIGTFVVSAVVMTLAGAILAPRRSYMDAGNAFNPEISFLTVIMALLGGANSAWGPMLGVVPLVVIQDYLSIAWASHFSVLLGLVLLGVVFFIPDGLIGLLRRLGARLSSDGLARILRRLADRIGRAPSAGGASLRRADDGGAGRPPLLDAKECKGRKERTTEP
jgi:branched-chain amino acid transport system permease protein